MIMAGLVCAIISGIWTNPTSSNLHSGYDLRRAADIIFIVFISVIFLLTLLMMSKSHEQKHNLVIVQDFMVANPLCPYHLRNSSSVPQQSHQHRLQYLGVSLIVADSGFHLACNLHHLRVPDSTGSPGSGLQTN